MSNSNTKETFRSGQRCPCCKKGKLKKAPRCDKADYRNYVICKICGFLVPKVV